MNRLSNCPRCGADVVLREGIKHGAAVWLVYDAESKKPHKFECGGTPTRGMRSAIRTGSRIVDKPATPHMLASAMGDIKYQGDPCPSCGGVIRYTKSRKCVACRGRHHETT